MSLRSFFRKAEQRLRPILKAALPAITGLVPGGNIIGPMVGGIGGGIGRRSYAPRGQSSRDLVANGYNPFGGSMSLLPAIVGTAGRVVLPGAGRAIVGGARAVGRMLPGAAGAAAGMALYDAAGNLVSSGRRRRRSKGITGTELKAFKRVTHVLSTYCKTPPPMKRRTSRTKACR